MVKGKNQNTIQYATIGFAHQVAERQPSYRGQRGKEMVKPLKSHLYVYLARKEKNLEIEAGSWRRCKCKKEKTGCLPQTKKKKGC